MSGRYTTHYRGGSLEPPHWKGTSLARLSGNLTRINFCG
jgi:hypothetical protein